MKVPASLSTIGWHAVYRLIGALFVAFLLGLVTGRMALSLALVLLIYACIQIRNMVLVDRWLRFRRVLPPPDISGPWGENVALGKRICRRRQWPGARVPGLIRAFAHFPH